MAKPRHRARSRDEIAAERQAEEERKDREKRIGEMLAASRANVRKAVKAGLRTFKTQQKLADRLHVKRGTLHAWTRMDNPTAPGLPNALRLCYEVQKSLDWLAGRPGVPEGWDALAGATDLPTALHKHLADEMVRRGVRPHAVQVLLPDAETLLAEIVDDYAETIDRLDTKEIRRQRQATAKGIVAELERNPTAFIQELRDRVRHIAEEHSLESSEPFSRQLVARSDADAKKQVRKDIQAMHLAALKLATYPPKRPVSETSTGVGLWPSSFGKDLRIREPSAEHQHPQDRIEAMRAKRRPKSKRRRKH